MHKLNRQLYFILSSKRHTDDNIQYELNQIKQGHEIYFSKWINDRLMSIIPCVYRKHFTHIFGSLFYNRNLISINDIKNIISFIEYIKDAKKENIKDILVIIDMLVQENNMSVFNLEYYMNI